MSNEQIDYEDLTDMRLDDDALAELLSAGGECVFNWTTKDGHPVGVVVAFVYHDGKFFTPAPNAASGSRRCASGHSRAS